jgi:hypothetical protein
MSDDDSMPSKGFVLTLRLSKGYSQYLTALQSLQKNRIPGPLAPLHLERSDNKYRKRPYARFSLTDINPATFATNVDLRKYMVITRASERLAEIFDAANGATRHKLLWDLAQEEFFDFVTPDEVWSDLLRMMLFGTFTNRTSGRDLDQTMPLREHFRATDMFVEQLKHHPNPRLLTSPSGLGTILFFCLTGQSFTTHHFLKTVGLPTCVEDFFGTLSNWTCDDPKCPKDPKRPQGCKFENSAQYGTPQGSMTFSLGKRTDLTDAEHRARVLARFNFYFGEELSQEWVQVLGEAHGWKINTPNIHPVPFKTLLHFFHRIGIEYGIPGLASGILPLQMTNMLVEVGLAETPPLAIASTFVAQEQHLGAAKALATLGFDLDDNAATVAVAFELTYKYVKSAVGDDSKLRFWPTDHEHRLCKLVRTCKLLGEAYNDKPGTKLLEWADRFLEDTDKQGITEEEVRICIEEIASK